MNPSDIVVHLSYHVCFILDGAHLHWAAKIALNQLTWFACLRVRLLQGCHLSHLALHASLASIVGGVPPLFDRGLDWSFVYDKDCLEVCVPALTMIVNELVFFPFRFACNCGHYPKYTSPFLCAIDNFHILCHLTQAIFHYNFCPTYC